MRPIPTPPHRESQLQGEGISEIGFSIERVSIEEGGLSPQPSCHPERMRGTSHLLITHTSLKNFDQLRGPSVRAGLAFSTRLGMTECKLHVWHYVDIVACQP